MTERNPRSRVFLSYATEDRSFAISIAKSLEARGVSVWYDLAVQVGSSLIDHISELISASDYLVVLISQNTKKSDWVMYELATAIKKELTARDITILPILIGDVEMPGFLQTYQSFDCRGEMESGIERLADQISAAPEIDFSRLTPEAFENLVADLLVKLQFTNIARSSPRQDVGYDFKAEYQRTDPFGLGTTETWLIECKFYRQSRADLKSIAQFLVNLSVFARTNRGLIVTNSQLTSVALEHLTSLESKTGQEIRVIDGTELKRLLIKHNDLVRKYFLKDEANNGESSN